MKKAYCVFKSRQNKCTALRLFGILRKKVHINRNEGQNPQKINRNGPNKKRNAGQK